MSLLVEQGKLGDGQLHQTIYESEKEEGKSTFGLLPLHAFAFAYSLPV